MKCQTTYGVLLMALTLSSACLLDYAYLYCLSCKYSSSGSTFEAPGHVQLNQTFVVLQSNAGSHTRTSGAPIHLKRSRTFFLT